MSKGNGWGRVAQKEMAQPLMGAVTVLIFPEINFFELPEKYAQLQHLITLHLYVFLSNLGGAGSEMP